jgi:hypothetical protein
MNFTVVYSKLENYSKLRYVNHFIIGSYYVHAQLPKRLSAVTHSHVEMARTLSTSVLYIHCTFLNGFSTRCSQ